jgi:Na+-transporting NADH:ubiquinone oxidoreductase subunit F
VTIQQIIDLLITAGIVAGISAGLAVLIVIIDAFVNNYGTVTLDINKGKKEIAVKGGSPLLLTLAEQDIFIPSACGGRGSCGACKVHVESDIGPVFPTEKPLLEQSEIDDNVRISCQIKVKSDLEISIPDELFNVKQFETTVVSIKDVTHDIKEIRFKLDNPDEITYVAGQYMQLQVPRYGKVREVTQRAYSMQSHPVEKDVVELLIRLVPGGIATTWVFEELKEGDKVGLIGPFGDFFRRETDADMICVAGGSGMAPLKSIIMDMIENNIKDRNVWYFFGARTEEDLFYVEEFMEIEKKWSKFHFIPALSMPEESPDWKGETGWITDVMDRYFKSSIDKDTPKEGYLCGSPGMIDACVDVLTRNGLPEDKIYYDKFA